jgi:hypothetical protein
LLRRGLAGGAQPGLAGGACDAPRRRSLRARVYLRTAEGDDAGFFTLMESAAVEAAVLVTCLSRSDAAVLGEWLRPPGHGRPEVEARGRAEGVPA